MEERRTVMRVRNLYATEETVMFNEVKEYPKDTVFDIDLVKDETGLLTLDFGQGLTIPVEEVARLIHTEFSDIYEEIKKKS